MNAAFRTLACLLLGTAVANAEPPATRVVILDNENLIEGEVTRLATGYQIRRAVGGDMTLPTSRVKAVVADRKEAFAFVCERANLRDADERLRLARWCSTNGLPTEALSEARIAAKMRPGFGAAERYAQSLEMTAKTAPVVDPAVVQAKTETPAGDKVTDVPVIDYNSESFPLFASRVNSVLVNACANCHARDDIKGFRLTRTSGRPGVTKNMMSALQQVNAAEPTQSPILVKALMPHGSATEAPFKTRNHPAFQTLETWARFARAADGTLEPERPLPTTEPRKLPDLPPPPPGNVFGQDSKTVPPKPTKTVADDPFDPAIFNGTVRPRK
ncbi:MAG TPA: hypothetical protein VHR66_00815 [Gemmataceae bacterium]|jgi:hypothetical protein|nr:hypothetical protein [Gemmataceae bacterium]